MSSANTNPYESPQHSPESRHTPSWIVGWLVVSWLWVGVPLAFGVVSTLIRASALFASAPAAATQPANPAPTAPAQK